MQCIKISGIRLKNLSDRAARLPRSDWPDGRPLPGEGPTPHRTMARWRFGPNANFARFCLDTTTLIHSLHRVDRSCVGIDREALRRLALLRALPHGAIGRLDVAGEALGVEQRDRSSRLRASFALIAASRAGSRASLQRQRLVVLERRRDQLRAARPQSSRLPATRLANVCPGCVISGNPAHSASHAVVCAL